MAKVAAPDSGDADLQGVMDVTREDQAKINRFARLNARNEDLKDDIQTKTNELKNYEDAMSEFEMKELEDEADKLHIQVGDILVNLESSQTQSWLTQRMEELKKSVEELEKKKEDLREEMAELKAHLYARFGDNIHLES